MASRAAVSVSSVGLVLASGFHDLPFTNCGTPKDILQDIALGATPYPPKAGDMLQIGVNGTLSTGLKSGKYTMQVSYDSLPIFSTSGDVCQLVASCPIPVGPMVASKTEALPSKFPSGTYSVHIAGTANGGAPLFCMDSKLVISSDGTEESLIASGKTAPFQALHHMIEAAREGEEKGFEADLEIEVGAEIELHVGAGAATGVDALDGDAVQKASNGDFNGAETLKNLAVGLAAHGDLDLKVGFGAKLSAGVAAGEAAFGERAHGGHGDHHHTEEELDMIHQDKLTDCNLVVDGEHPVTCPSGQTCTVDADTQVGRCMPWLHTEVENAGGDRDQHGCIASAGYSWCADKNRCVRLFEENCESEVEPLIVGDLVILSSSESAVRAAFDNADGYVWADDMKAMLGHTYPVLSLNGNIAGLPSPDCSQNGVWYFPTNLLTKLHETEDVGGDRDQHGCIASAGYSWCADKNRCVRLFEENCESKEVVDCTLLENQACFTSNDCELVDGTCVHKRVFMSIE